jgi:hypothetical protein
MIAAVLILAAAVEPLAVTNLHLVSQGTNISAWTRQAVMAKEDNTIIDPSGVFVAAAESAAHSNAADRIVQLSDAAVAGMRSAVGALEAVTNQVPKTAYHISLALPPPSSPASLMGYVVKESTDGDVDTQWVWYSHRLSRKPIRRVVYRTPSGEFSQNAEWVDWSEDGETISAYGRTWQGCHKCTILRPAAARGISAVSRLNEVFGGSSGFDFGSVIVTIGGKAGVTTNLVDAASGVKLSIKNGFFQNTKKDAAE